MNNTVNKIKISLTTGILIGIQPAIAMTPEVETASKQSPSTSNQMVELSTEWGFEPTKCTGNIAEIKHNLTGETACVVPNQTVGVGKFIYDSANNKIRPLEQESGSDSVAATETQSEEYTNPVAQTPDPRIDRIVFSFDNAYDYSACLDAVLLAYEQRQVELEKTPKNECAEEIFRVLGQNLSHDVTLQLVTAADKHATQELEDKLYPPLGLRRRVAINVGYVYEIDRNNSDMLEYASKSRQ